MWPDPHLQFDSIGLDRPEGDDVIDREAAIQQDEFEIVELMGELDIRADRPEDHLGGELLPLEQPISIHCRFARRVTENSAVGGGRVCVLSENAAGRRP